MIIAEISNAVAISYLVCWCILHWQRGYRHYSMGDIGTSPMEVFAWIFSPILVPFFVTLHRIGFVDLDLDR